MRALLVPSHIRLSPVRVDLAEREGSTLLIKHEIGASLPLRCTPAHYYLLPTTYHLLPTTYYLLPTTCYLLPVTISRHVQSARASDPGDKTILRGQGIGGKQLGVAVL